MKRKRANDAVPEDEMLLAKLIQNAKARGLKWTSGAFFRDVAGAWEDDKERAVSCCAIGASMLAPDTKMVSEFNLVVVGNDGYEGEILGYSGPGFDIGAAFRDAMT